VIETDDQALNTFRRDIMPRTFRLLVDRGTVFGQSLAAPPLCCPSRAGFLTGQYPHNHGVFTNPQGYGALRDPENVLPAWLNEAGYRTGVVGKYLNGTDDEIGAEPAPGWDRWYVTTSNPGMRDPRVSDDGHLERGRGHLTAVVNREARRFVGRSADSTNPFFLWVTHFAPHAAGSLTRFCRGGLPQPSGAAYRAYDGPGLPRVKSPSFNEADISDKPSVAMRPRFDDAAKRELRRRYRCAAAAVTQVDRGVADLVRKLRSEGELDQTIVAFTSDNGFFFGEHRLPHGKSRPFDEAFRVPLAMRVPRDVLGAGPPDRIARQVAQIDLPPTFLELAGASSCLPGVECRRMDGRSLVSLLEGDAGAWPGDRGVMLEVGEGCKRRAGLRTSDWLVSDRFRPCGGAPELYHRDRDPHQLRSVAKRRSDVVGALKDRLKALRECSGVEGRDPPVSGAPFCE
jgi:arylsulfatase A-like enzyme